MRRCAEISFFSIQIIRLGSLVSFGMASCSFSAGHTWEAHDPRTSNVARPGTDSGLFWCRNIFQQCSCGPKSVDQVLVSVLCQTVLVWPRWKMLVCFEELFFSAPSSILQCWAGVQVVLGHGVLRWSDLQHSKDSTLNGRCLNGHYLANEETFCSSAVGCSSDWCIWSRLGSQVAGNFVASWLTRVRTLSFSLLRMT